MPQVQVLPGVPTFGGTLGNLIGTGIGQGISANLSQMLEHKNRQRQLQNLEREYVSRGMSQPLASLAAVATRGGQTEAFKYLLEEMRRGNESVRKLDDMLAEQDPASPKVPLANEETADVQIDTGLTPAEKIKREEGRFAKQFDTIEEERSKNFGYDSEKTRLDRLEILNKSGELPSGLQRWNVNFKTGELIFPFLANAPTQEFQKIINDFTTSAKDSYGARVTNFDLNQFMKRLPGLLNTEEGRESIIRQMKLMNEINRLHSQALVETVEQRGGIRKIDLDIARKLSERKIKPEINRLKNEYAQNIESVPTDSEKGFVKMRDPSGKLRRISKSDIMKAQKAGYKLER